MSVGGAVVSILGPGSARAMLAARALLAGNGVAHRWIDTDADPLEIYTTPGALEKTRKALEQGGVKVDSAESAMIARQTVELDSAKARQALRLIELLEDLDDVQRVTANFEIPEEVFAEVAG